MAEARPDPFIRYKYGELLDRSRAAIAAYVNAPLEGVVLVSNATTGVNVVLRALAGEWNNEALVMTTAKDSRSTFKIKEILYFDTVYGGCCKSINYVVDTSGGRLRGRKISLRYPCEDNDVVEALREGIRASRSTDEDSEPALAMFDVTSSIPGVSVPWERLAAVCREEGVLSLVDGAQGVGMVDVDLSAGDPDFFVSNCHKWMHVPRGCAILYVAERNHGYITSTIPTSFGYKSPSFSKNEKENMRKPLLSEDGKKSAWSKNFEFIGTVDNAPLLCVADSIVWRRDYLGGEERILRYQNWLAREGGKIVAESLGTEVLENTAGTLIRSAMVNVALPLVIKGVAEEWTTTLLKGGNIEANTVVLEDETEAAKVMEWFLRTLIEKHDTYVAIFAYRKKLWVRLSAQVFLDIEDFQATAQILKEVCDMVAQRGQKDSK